MNGAAAPSAQAHVCVCSGARKRRSALKSAPRRRPRCPCQLRVPSGAGFAAGALQQTQTHGHRDTDADCHARTPNTTAEQRRQTTAATAAPGARSSRWPCRQQSPRVRVGHLPR